MKNEVRIDELTGVFRDIGRNLVWLSLSGGEITLISYYKELIRSAKKHCPELRIVTFTTNGLNTERIVEYASFTKELGFDFFVNISMDGDETLHDSLRGVPGNHKKCIHTFERLKKRGIKCHFALTVSPGNLLFIKERYESLNRKIKAVTFVHGGGIYNRKNRIDYTKLQSGLLHIFKYYRLENPADLIELIHIKIAYLFLKQGMKKNLVPCEVITTNLHIMPHGEVKPCMFMPSLGNIRNRNIGDIIGKKRTQDMRSKIRAGKCPGCWMNCYSPHSIMQHPLLSLWYLFR